MKRPSSNTSSAGIDTPPSSTSRESSPGPLADAATYNPQMQLRRYITEIMGFTFDVDFTLLNRALDPTVPISATSPTKSILTPHERAELLSLVTLIKEVYAKLSDPGAQWLTVRDCDRETIAEAVVRPALHLGLSAGYLLEILSTYDAHQCDENKRSLSFISQKKPYCYDFWTRLAFLGPFNIVMSMCADELWAHGQIIGIASPNERVRIVLGNALDAYQKEILHIKNLQTMASKSNCESTEWRKMSRALLLEDEHITIEVENEFKEDKRRRKKVESDAKRYDADANQATNNVVTLIPSELHM
ncbi:hypothetical protein P280DRAFT_521637 [Massarina eburnea CBS 473.64]|uniref:Uncharacterized protein n=1 Tax=Massarina eburnea CBS 473.64 TaxID=1395130 RepID=A0A6A6RR78_9PLEO|nr:hypothetical protein P280DRAFT_521637 [Massarina eburnea CBS 473.64]